MSARVLFFQNYLKDFVEIRCFRTYNESSQPSLRLVQICSISSCVYVTIDGVWIGEWIY
jgi:hypothetical protein